MDAVDPRLRDDTSSAVRQYPEPPQVFSDPAQISEPSTGHQPQPHPHPYPSHYYVPHQSQVTSQPLTYDPAIENGPGGHGTPDSGHNQEHEVGADGQKRPRACEACRGLKVRCEFDGNNPEGACKRCAKARRNCVVTQPSRKRQKKTDSRVAELEKKIDALTASLHAQKSQPALTSYESPSNVPEQHSTYEQISSGSYPPHHMFLPGQDTRLLSGDWDSPTPKPSEVESRKNAPSLEVITEQKHKQADLRSPSGSTQTASSNIVKLGGESSPTPAGLGNTESVPERQRIVGSEVYTDAIDRGLLTAEAASRMFQRYTERMAPLMPAVVFPQGTTMTEIRETKPVLFLAILSVASGSDQPNLQRTLTKEVMQVYANRIMCAGEKNLELVQALLVSSIWYLPPEHFEELKFYQVIHAAAVMAIDLSLNRKSKTPKLKTNIVGSWRDQPWKRTSMPDPETLEARRAWLACYFVCCAASMGLRRTNLIKWTSYMDDCVQVLETSSHAAPSDKVLCQWVRSQHLAEEVGNSFSMDDSFAVVAISDSKVLYALKGFERDLEKWSDQVPEECQNRK